MAMAALETERSERLDEYDAALAALDAAKTDWARTSVTDRIAILQEIKEGINQIAQGWAETAARKKQIPENTPLVGEEWLSGPYALMSACNALMLTLSQMEGKAFVKHLPTRELPTGQTAVKLLPHSIWDRLLLSGVKAEVWMQDGITTENLADHAAIAYDEPIEEREGAVALVLGAGNIAAISPLDCFQKLFTENQVVLLKMNPINDYLTEFLEVAMKPLIERDALRIVKGDGAEGQYLTEHPLVAEMHITGSGATHDAIVWGTGAEGEANKKAGTPRNTKRFTSELGAVCPTIVVPGPWTEADLQFQAENIATQKMHNSGFNCVACQVLLMPNGWNKADQLMTNLKRALSGSTRQAYYPRVLERLAAFRDKADNVVDIQRGQAPALAVNQIKGPDDAWFHNNEVFGPALSTHGLYAPNAEAFLVSAIEYANNELYGTLGANIVIHPKTIRKIGKKRFESIIAELRYGTIGVNAWTGLGFLLVQCPWGAFPGHTLEDVQSGIGTVHNTYMLEKTERVVLSAPWRPFPRGLLSGQMTLLPRPPWFITNKKQHKIGALLTKFQYKPSWLRLPRIFLNALLG